MTAAAWIPAVGSLRVLSLREAQDSWVHGWATVVYSFATKGRLVAACPPHVTQHVWWLADTTDHHHDLAPRAHHVASLVERAAELQVHDRLVVHCHGGMNRSTAAALVVMLARGADPVAAIDLLHRIRPTARPNPLIVRLAEAHFGVDLVGPLRDVGLAPQGEAPRPGPGSGKRSSPWRRT